MDLHLTPEALARLQVLISSNLKPEERLLSICQPNAKRLKLRFALLFFAFGILLSIFRAMGGLQMTFRGTIFYFSLVLLMSCFIYVFGGGKSKIVAITSKRLIFPSAKYMGWISLDKLEDVDVLNNHNGNGDMKFRFSSRPITSQGKPLMTTEFTLTGIDHAEQLKRMLRPSKH